MQIIELLAGALKGLLRLLLKLIGLALALAMVLFILTFILILALLSLLRGRKPTVNVSTHFSRVLVFTNLGQFPNRPNPGEDPDPRGIEALRRRQVGDVQDVKVRELPPERGPDGR
jgi:hypothetical protein